MAERSLSDISTLLNRARHKPLACLLHFWVTIIVFAGLSCLTHVVLFAACLVLGRLAAEKLIPEASSGLSATLRCLSKHVGFFPEVADGLL